jgi:threonine synthase
VSEVYELRCRECGRRYGNQPLSICDECFSPLEVVFDLDRLRGQVTRASIAAGPQNMWRYSALLPLQEGYHSDLPTGMTPLQAARRFGRQVGATSLYIKNDAVCLPTLSFKDRVVSTAIAAARRFGFDTIGCSSTGNLANAVAAQAAREGLQAFILVPADLEPAKIIGTQVYGARLVRD